MNPSDALNEYLVISRGQWDADRPPEEIQRTIDAFYAWHAGHVEAGRMKPGSRLARESRRVSRRGVTDGPFAEAKEVVGGFWFIRAASLDEAARIAAGNPCLAVGLQYEVRPLEAERCDAFALTSETPAPEAAVR